MQSPVTFRSASNIAKPTDQFARLKYSAANCLRWERITLIIHDITEQKKASAQHKSNESFVQWSVPVGLVRLSREGTVSRGITTELLIRWCLQKPLAPFVSFHLIYSTNFTTSGNSTKQRAYYWSESIRQRKSGELFPCDYFFTIRPKASLSDSCRWLKILPSRTEKALRFIENNSGKYSNRPM